MVTKQCPLCIGVPVSLILAKNHMVTKQSRLLTHDHCSLILAKNHMVTKPQIHVTIYLKIIKY